MATIVLVHGIAQEQLGAASLEKSWLPALADGVANSGNRQLADRIWRNNASSDIDIRMAYYGTRLSTRGPRVPAVLTWIPRRCPTMPRS